MSGATGWVSRQANLGWEETHGVLAPTDTLTTMGEVKVETKGDPKSIKASGDLHPTIVIPGKETSEWSISDGFPCRRHLVFWFAMLYGIPTVDLLRPATATHKAVYKYTFHEATSTDDVLSATIAIGGPVFAVRVGYALMTAMTLGWNTQSGDSDMSASGIAQTVALLERDATDPDHVIPALAPATERLVPSPVDAKNIEVSLAGSLSALDSDVAVSDNIYAVEFETSSRFKDFATMRRGVPGYNRSIVVAPVGKLTVQQLSDADSRDWYRKFRDSETVYVKVDELAEELAPALPAVGDTPAEDAIYEEFIVTAAIQAGEAPKEEEDDDAVVVTTEGTIVTDRDGFSSRVEIVTDQEPLPAWLV